MPARPRRPLRGAALGCSETERGARAAVVGRGQTQVARSKQASQNRPSIIDPTRNLTRMNLAGLSPFALRGPARGAAPEPLWLEWLALAGMFVFAAWLLGSQGVWALLLRSDPTGISDLDFLVGFDAAPSSRSALSTYFGFKESLEAMFGHPVDLLMPGAVRNPFVRADIEPTRQLLYAA